MKRAAVRAFLLALLLFPVSFAGCGPSYEDAVKVYEAELSILDKLENDRKALDENHAERQAGYDRVGADLAIFRDNPAKYDKMKAEYDKGYAEFRAEVESVIPKSDAALAEQRKRVSDAKALVDRLAK